MDLVKKWELRPALRSSAGICRVEDRIGGIRMGNIRPSLKQQAGTSNNER